MSPDLPLDEIVGAFCAQLAGVRAGDRDRLNEVAAAVTHRLCALSPSLSGSDLSAAANRILQRVADRIGLPLPRLGLRALPRAQAPLRDERWVPEAQLVIDLRLTLDRILQTPRWPCDSARLGGLVLASAALRAGLWRPEALAALAAQLADPAAGPKRAARFPDLAWFDLVLKIPRAEQDQTNLEPGAELLRFFPDVVTLHLIEAFRASPNAEAPPATVTGAHAALLEALGRTDLSRRLSPAGLARAGVAALEVVSGIRIPTAVAAVGGGALPGLSLLSEQWEAVCHGADPARMAVGQPADPPPASGRPRRRRLATAGLSVDLRQPLEALDAAIAAHTRTSSRAGTAVFRAELEALRAAHGGVWPAFEALVSWYLALLRAGDKPRTVGDYHGLCGRRLLVTFGDADPVDLEPRDLGLRFAQALALASASHPGRAAGRIGHFARHANQVLDWPACDLGDLVPEGGQDGPGCVRTAFVPGPAIPAAVDAILTADGVSRRARESYALAVLILAYGGLRLDELCGLMVADVLADLSVHVHCTPGSGLKTDPSRRLVPLGLLLPPDRRAWVQRVVARRRKASPAPRQEKLFDEAGLFAEDRFDPAELRRLLGATLGTALGLPVRPHDFRHSFISALQLLFYLGSAGEDAIEALTGWSPPRQRSLRQRLIGPSGDPGRLPRRLAALAGHSDLGTTSFASYVHLNDLALGRMVLGAPERVAADAAGRMLGLNARSLAGLVAADGTVRLEDLRGRVVDRLDLPVIGMAGPAGPGVPAAPPAPEPLTPHLVLAILDRARLGIPALDLAVGLDRPVDEVDRVLAEAGRLMALETRKGTRRIGAQRAAPDAAPDLLPPARFAKRETRFLDRILEMADRVPPEDRHDWAMTVLTRSDRHRSHLRFRSAEAFRRWWRLCPDALSPSAITVTLQPHPTPGPDTDRTDVRKLLGREATIETRTPPGDGRGPPAHALTRTLTLAIRADGSPKHRRSLAALRRAAFLIAVTERARRAPG